VREQAVRLACGGSWSSTAASLHQCCRLGVTSLRHGGVAAPAAVTQQQRSRMRGQQDGLPGRGCPARRQHVRACRRLQLVSALVLAVVSLRPAAALRIGVATYEPDKLLGSSGMSIGIVAAHLLGRGAHTGNMITQPGGFASAVAIHDVILAHGVCYCTNHVQQRLCRVTCPGGTVTCSSC
jgi:hypothetical protein